MNRLARALVCIGKFNFAKRMYNKVLTLDAYNIIATKNLEKLAKSKDNRVSQFSEASLEKSTNLNLSNLFLNEPGKTKLIRLLNLAPPQIIATLNCGDEVFLKTKSHSVAITSAREIYLGALPDDLAHRLISFIDGGNKYAAYVKSAAQKSLTVFIKEIFKSTKYANQPSFQYSPDVFADEKSYKMF